jgi:hypothetical protein
MSTTEQTGEPVIVHFLRPMVVATGISVLGQSRVVGYGDEMIVTDEVRQASLDRNGDSWWRWLDQGADEYRRGDQVICRRGPWPKGRLRLEPGSPVWEDARRRAIADALSLTDPEQRHEARRQVDVEFGPAQPTSRTIRTVGPGDGQAAT